MTDAGPPNRRAPVQYSRRAAGIVAGAALIGGGLFAAQWFNIGASAEGALSAPQAHTAAVSGDIVLIDIRRPDEWARTGVPEGALALDMRREDFTDMLLAKLDGDRSMPVALICARGVRSRRLSERLIVAGFTSILDVPEGMLGSGAGPGWLDRGLPVVAWQEG